jgi:hypothetical protein
MKIIILTDSLSGQYEGAYTSLKAIEQDFPNLIIDKKNFLLKLVNGMVVFHIQLDDLIGE